MGGFDLALTLGSNESGLGAPVILVCCLLFAAIGLWGLVRNVHRLLTWPTTTGTVVGHNPASGDQRLLTPVIAFQTQDGRPVRGGDQIGSRRGRYSVGKQVRLRYDAQNPSRVMVGYLGTLVYGFLFVWMLGSLIVLLIFF